MVDITIFEDRSGDR